MRPERQGYQPPIFDDDQSAHTMNFSSARAPYGASRTFGQVAQTLNLGAQDAEWIQVPRSTQGPNTERSIFEWIRIPRSTQVTSEERSESQRIHVPNPFQDTNRGRSELLPTEVPIFIQGRNETTNESERGQLLDPTLDQFAERSSHTRQHEEERSSHSRQHEDDERRHESICDVIQELIWSPKCICARFIDRFSGLPDEDVLIFKVLFLISLQLLVIAILTMVCLQEDARADSVVHSHQWVLGLSFSMCFYVIVVRTCCEQILKSPAISIVMFLTWSAGVVLTVSWITVLLSFDFLSLLIFFLWLWIASILVSGFIFAQQLISYYSVLTSLCVVAGSIELFITVGNKSITSVLLASCVSLLLLIYLVWRLSYLIEGGYGWSVPDDVFYLGTCVMF